MLGLCHSPPQEEIAAAVSQLSVKVLGKELKKYQYGIVMLRADRSLHAVFMSERPDLSLCQVYLKEIAAALEHLHSHGIVHLDVKPLNVGRRYNHMLISDLSSACVWDDQSYAGAKFNSGVLPPEMFYKLETQEQEDQFNEYFRYVDRSSSQWEKIQAMETPGGKYVVRTFNDALSSDTAHNLPYKLVKAHPTQDIWGFGSMAFMLLTAQSIVSVDRDDGLAGPEALLTAATWTDKKIAQHLTKHCRLIKDDNVIDFLQKLLKVDPKDRFQSMADVLCHPFLFDSSKSGHAKNHAETSSFIKLAKEYALTPIDYVPTIVDVKWKFNKLQSKLDHGNGQWTQEDTTMATGLLELTKTTLKRMIDGTMGLSPETSKSLTKKVHYDEYTVKLLIIYAWVQRIIMLSV